mgnify:CR=1 FL=1
MIDQNAARKIAEGNGFIAALDQSGGSTPKALKGYGVEEARGMLDTAYGWLEAHLKGRSWAAGGDFTLADCAAAPSLFYADWAHEIAPHFAQVRAYRARLLQHPAVKQAVDGGRPYRSYFPLGAPDRD